MSEPEWPAMPGDASRIRPARRPGETDGSCQPLLERDRAKRPPVGQWLGGRNAGVTRRVIERLRLGLTIPGDQVQPPVPARGGLLLQRRQQHLRVTAAPVRAVGPDPLEFGGVGVETPKRPAGDRYAAQNADEQAT